MRNQVLRYYKDLRGEYNISISAFPEDYVARALVIYKMVICKTNVKIAQSC